MPPFLIRGADPVILFDDALSKIWKKAKSKGEVALVKRLIKKDSIQCLNDASSKIYDENINAVRFFGGMIHGHPIAKFTASVGGGTTTGSRELADMLIVIISSSSDANGLLKIDSKRACLIQAKMSARQTSAKMPPYDPLVALPDGSHQEQHYLLNRWPNFTLSSGLSSKSYTLSSLPNPHSMGKYVHICKKNLPSGWPDNGHYWSWSNPVANTLANGSLGDLLSKIINFDPNSGRNFASPPSDDWDELIADLVSFCTITAPSGVQRLADPGNFSSFIAHQEIASVLQVKHGASAKKILELLPRFFPTPPEIQKDILEDGFPVLFVSLSKFISNRD
jgi:hypothetical protein